MEKETFRKSLNLFLTAGSVLFVISFSAATIQWYRINSEQIETKLFPVAVDYTFVDWERGPDGTWSAELYVNKVRPCEYVKNQVETVVGVTPDGEIYESTVTHVGDMTGGSTRPLGWQKLDKRVRIDNPDLVEGSVLNGAILHRCHPGNATVTEFGPVTIGVNMEAPSYATKPST